MSTKKTAARVLPGILAAIALALVAVFAFGQAQTAQAIAGSTPQEKWNSFKQAVEAGGTVTLDEDLIAFSKIDVSKAATVNGTGTIYRYADDANFPVFNVTSGGDLTLAGDVVLSGKKKGCSEDSGDDGGDTVGEEGQVVWWNFGNEALSASNSDEVFGYSQIWDNDENGHEAGTWNMWKINAVNGNTLTLWTTNNYSSAEKELDFSTSDYNFYDINNIGTNLTEFFAGDYVFAISKGSSGAGSGSGSGSGSGGSQGCDADGSCGDYTSDDFSSGTPDAARGFFVQVDGGTATLAGATLTDFVADGTVHHVAPVAVNNGGTFDVTSGSITHNSVGYTADNSYWDAPAYSFGGRAIGKEDETGTGTYNGAMAGWAKTETAGGIIYNNGSSGTISGGDISGNRGDTGGVLVQGQGNNETDVNATKTDGATSKVKLTGGAIDNNLGVHHGGGMSVYNGAAVQMDGGTISDNFSWHKGGGVFVSEEVFGSMRAVDYYGEPARIKAGSAAFTMNDGTISGNVAVLRGGGINVTSDHVALLGGSILNNNARVLGGGVYVEGDSGRMYQLYVANGCISGNSALSVAEEGAASSGPSNTAGGCNFDNALATPNTDVTYVDGFWGEKGDGGGLWLCPLGGNATFAISEGHNVIIGGNSASSNGTDIYVTQPRSGIGNGVNVVSLGANNDFTDQATGAKLQANTTYAGELALANSVQECDGKLTIQGNSAPNGGGIGANGTVIFGEAQDTYRTSAGLELTKVWGSDRSKDPITLKLYAQVGDQKAALGEVTLDGVADNEGEAAEDFNENTALYESAPWVASIGLPLAVTMPDGTTQPLFTTSAGDPSDPEVLKAIYGSGEELALADWNLVIEEADASGKAMTYVLPSGDATLDNVEKLVETEVSYTDIDGHPLASAGTYSVNFSFSQEIANDNEPTIEKYVAKDVHKDILINEEYPYDILVYVPLTADELKITDKLNAKLQYVSDEAAIEKSAVIKETNDHTVGGTVAGTEGQAIAAKATITGQDLTVEFADVEAARGKYIQISFVAKVKEGTTFDQIAANDKETIKDNATVLGGAAEHTGIPNTASYTFKADNTWSSEYDSNTVTVEPKEEKPEIEKYVNKNVHSNIKLDEVFTYDVLAYVTKDADNLVITDKLDSQLQFVSANADVKVVALGETVDHAPNGSVAGEGTTVDGAAANISGDDTLTVTIADAKALRGQWVKVTFDAKIKEGSKVKDLKLTEIKDAAEEKRTAPNVGNDPVVTDEDHEGVPNTATYTIGVGNKSDFYSDTSNTVTVKPEEEKPAIEKYVNKNVHKDIALDETFTYDIVAYVTRDADATTIVDKLDDQLQFVSKQADVKVACLGATVDHKPNGSVAQDGTDITDKAKVTINGQNLVVVIDPAKDYRGQWVKVTFDAKIKDGTALEALQYTKIDKNAPVLTEEAHEGVPNSAEYTIKVDNDSEAYSDNSNTVTVKPTDEGGNEDKPQIEKYVNKNVHKDITLDEVFPYDVIVYVPSDADTIQIRDVLDSQLQFADNAEDIAKTAVVKATNNHTVNGTVAAADGQAIAATATISGQTLTVDIADATAARGKYIQITFLAKIAEGKTLADLKYEAITTNGSVVGGAASHEGVPNTAEYRIGVKNGNEVDYSKYGGENPEGWNESNTVTVKPSDGPTKTFEILFSKTDMTDGAGSELPGAHIKVYDSEGNLVDEWVSGTEPHKLNLAPGTYTFEEVNAPEGFDAITTTVTFEVDENGNVKLIGAYEDINGKIDVKDLNHLVLSDMPTKPNNDGDKETDGDGTGGNDNNNSGNNQNSNGNNGGSSEDDGTGGRSTNQTPNTTRTPGNVNAYPSTSTTRSATATSTPSASSVSRSLSRTADDLGPAIFGLGALAILAFGAGAISLRRNRKDS